MEQFLYYLLRASVVMTLFYGFYKLLFGKNTFYRINRIVLILLTITACTIPIFRFSILPEKKQEPIITENITFDFSEIPVVEYNAEPQIVIPWLQILFVIFIVGLVFAITRYIIGLIQLRQIIQKSEKQTLADNSILCITEKDVLPFSWFQYIVLSHTDMNAENSAIINHERAHIHLLHSLDMIFFDLFTCVFWFNPFSWLLRREIQSVHEYQADEKVLQNGIDAKQYQLLLIRKSVGEHKFSLANNFRQRDLHKRIRMMTKNKTNKRMKWSYSVALPMLFMAIAVLSIPKLNAKIVEKEVENTISTTEKITVSGQVVDEAGKAIVGVAILNSKDKSGTASDLNGNFVFETEKGATVSFIMVNYKERKVTFNKSEKNFKVVLEKGDGESKEMVTTQIKGKNEVSGTRSTSERTITELMEGKPLFVLDGTKIVESVDNINTDNIKSISVLKGKAATVVYGEKAKNGVVVIITKDGNGLSKKKKETTATIDDPVISFRENSGKALIVVDGEIKGAGYELNSIKASEIDNITVLKDKAAIEKYGEKGKNGVIHIITKSNKEIN